MNLQLPLSISLRDDASFENYVCGANEQIVQHLIRCVQGRDSDGAIYLWGNFGVGVSHLLHAACHAAGDKYISAVYLPLAELMEESTAIFEGLETISVVCIDDIESIAGNIEWETALFHLFNRIYDAGAQLIIGANCTVSQLGLILPDLASRLSWGFVYRLHDLKDEDKLMVLKTRAMARGLDLSDNVGHYLLKRYPRDMTQLYALLNELDVASLAAQRKLTIPFIKSWLDGSETTQQSLF